MSLTEEQKSTILREWESNQDDPPSLLELIRKAYPDNLNIDGRSKEGKEVKAFLAKNNIKTFASHEYQAKEKIELTKDQIKFLEENHDTTHTLGLAKIVFKNDQLTSLHGETRAVTEYVKKIKKDVIDEESQKPEASVDEEGKYKPPKTFIAGLARINKYVPDKIDKEKISNIEKKAVKTLMGYINTYRFLHQIGNYENEVDRELFESSMIRYTYDKPDLTQEEIDQYIVLSVEVVIASNIQRRVERLNILLDTSANDTEGRRIAMSLVDAISTAQTEYHQSINRQQKLLESLKQKRSDKLKSQIRENASILNLVQVWKEEESRVKLIKLATLRKKSLEGEVEKLTDMDEIKCKILGLSVGEVLDE